MFWYELTNVIVAGVNDSPKIMEEGREPGLEDADREAGLEAGLEPCCERGIFSFSLLAPDFELKVLLWDSVAIILLRKIFNISKIPSYKN